MSGALAAYLAITPARTVGGRSISGALTVSSARAIAKTTVSRALTAPLTLALAVAVLIPILLAYLCADRGLARHHGSLHLRRGHGRRSDWLGRAHGLIPEYKR